MTTTTYYDLNIVEGTDIVNPLTVDNPNYQKIDETMHNNAVAGVTLATELTNATIHALTRENSDCSVIRFIATSRWKAGDSVTVDGVPVLALLPSGETLPDGAYVINANVLCVLTGTNLTVYVGKSATDANEIAYKDTNVEAALNSLNESLVTVTGDLSTVSSNVSTLTTSLEEVNSELQNLTTIRLPESKIDLTSYNSVNNKYLVPSDGYLQLDAPSNTTGILYACNTNSAEDIGIDIGYSYSGRQDLFIKKGMYIYHNGGFSLLKYTPINYSQ